MLLSFHNLLVLCTESVFYLTIVVCHFPLLFGRACGGSDKWARISRTTESSKCQSADETVALYAATRDIQPSARRHRSTVRPTAGLISTSADGLCVCPSLRPCLEMNTSGSAVHRGSLCLSIQLFLISNIGD